MKRIAIVVGSLREGSLNRQLAEHIARAVGEHAEVSWLDYADLPPMNQDIEWPVADTVARVRADVERADGLWFVSPEYNGSYPGHVKNLVDWLSRPTDVSSDSVATAIQGKRVTMSGVGGRAATSGMRAALHEVLARVGADVMGEPAVGIALASELLASDTLPLSEEDMAAIREQADAFFAFVSDMGGVESVPVAEGVPANGSVPSEPTEGGVFATGVEVGSCSSQGCSVH